MAELIQKQDTLNEGRVKINAAITDAEQAKVTADGADTKATQALANSENTQTQLDTIVINGDSSVEAAQARVDEKGVGHTTLKDRIDDGFTKVTSQLNETKKKTERFSNAEYPLSIRTYEGYNQVVHPDVKYFSNPWNGYRYWMAYTPYPWTNDFYENPSIVASKDGVEWVTPEGLVNPLDEVTQSENDAGIHLSDTALVYNDNTDALECWYRWTDEANRKEKFFRRTTTDGVNWTPKELVYEKDDILVSPSIVFEDGKYKMWAVASYEGYKIIKTETTTPNMVSSWSAETIIPVTYKDDGRQGTIWHIHIYKESNNLYHLTWNEKTGSIFWATSTDGNSFENCIEIIKPSKGEGRWDNVHLYRPTLTKVDELYRFYYSALGLSPGRWNVGLVEGKSMETLYSSQLINSEGFKEVSLQSGIRSKYDMSETKTMIVRSEKGEEPWIRMIERNRAGAGLKLGDKTGTIKVVSDNGNSLGEFEAASFRATNYYGVGGNAGLSMYDLVRILNEGDKSPRLKFLHRGKYGATMTIDQADTITVLRDNETETGHFKVASLIVTGDDFRQVGGAIRHNKEINKIQALTGNYWHNLNSYNPNVPNAPIAPGAKGDYAADENYLYVCYTGGRWIRISKDGDW